MRISGGIKSRRPLLGQRSHLPMNRGLSQIAQEALDSFATQAARKSVEAIAVDSWPVYVHRIGPGTQICSCRKEDDREYFEGKGLNTLDKNRGIEESFATPEDGILGRNSYKTTVRLRGHGNHDSTLKTTNGRSDYTPTFDDLTQTETITQADVDGNYPAQPNDDFSDLVSMFPSLASQCAICGGIGMRDEYEWVSGTKILCVAETMEADGNVTIDRSTKPWSIVMPSDNIQNFAQWIIDIPAYHMGLEIIRVRDNMKLSTEFIVEARNPLQSDEDAGDAWVRFNQAFLTPYLTTGIRGLRVRVRLKPSRVAENADAVFTHLEIWIRANELPRCQFPQIDRDNQGGSGDSLIMTEFEIDPGVGKLGRGSLIENPAMGRMFIVTGIVPKETSKRYVFNVTGRLTLVSPSDGPYGLAAKPRFSGQDSKHWRGAERSTLSRGLPYSQATYLSDDLPITNDEIDK